MKWITWCRSAPVDREQPVHHNQPNWGAHDWGQETSSSSSSCDMHLLWPSFHLRSTADSYSNITWINTCTSKSTQKEQTYTKQLIFPIYCDLHRKIILQLIGMGLSNTVYWLSCIQGWTSVKGLLIEVADYRLILIRESRLLGEKSELSSIKPLDFDHDLWKVKGESPFGVQNIIKM